MTLLDPYGDEPITHAQLVADGCDRDDIRRALRSGDLVRMRRKVFVTGPAYRRASADPQKLHALEVRCLICALERKHIAAAAGTSAARIHGLEMLKAPGPDLVVCTGDPGVSGTHKNDYYLRGAYLPVDHVEVRHGVRVTTVARTLLDLAAGLPFADALVATESAYRRGLTTADALEAVLESWAGRPGVRGAREVFGFADPATQSVLESLSRASMRELGISMPRCQSVIVVDGREIHLDFDWWPELDLAGESDGLEKYLPPEGSDRQATLRAIGDEKARERRVLQRRGELVRWGYRDAIDANRLGAILLPALARAERRANRAS
ncbi:MAG: hypothetical protein ACT4QF_12475 [Sporichthyaceae bacterium]